MNDAHLHLLVNHFPIITPILGVLLLLLGFVFKAELIKRSAYFIFIVGAIMTVPAFSSGEGAEEVIEHMGGSHDLIHEHEEVAETFAMLSYVLGALALMALIASWRKMKFSMFAGVAVLLMAGAVIYMGKLTGTSGGEITHTEIRQGGNATTNDAADQGHEQEEDHEDHEEND